MARRKKTSIPAMFGKALQQMMAFSATAGISIGARQIIERFTGRLPWPVRTALIVGTGATLAGAASMSKATRPLIPAVVAGSILKAAIQAGPEIEREITALLERMGWSGNRLASLNADVTGSGAIARSRSLEYTGGRTRDLVN
jgi:hypothetical protein